MGSFLTPRVHLRVKKYEPRGKIDSRANEKYTTTLQLTTGTDLTKYNHLLFNERFPFCHCFFVCIGGIFIVDCVA